MSEYYKFFQNKKCEYFPCHKGIPEENFNCLFCYCPLYTLGKSCGGNCEFLENGVKSCMKCGFPHQRSNYDKVISRFRRSLPLWQPALKVRPSSAMRRNFRVKETDRIETITDNLIAMGMQRSPDRRWNGDQRRGAFKRRYHPHTARSPDRHGIQYRSSCS